MIDITLFGPTTVAVEGVRRSTCELGGPRNRQILEMLAVHLGEPLTKDKLAEDLWDGTPPPTFLANLESYVCTLRRGLGAGQGKHSVLATTQGGYVLDADRVRVDLTEVRGRMSAARGATPRRAVHEAEAALSLVQGTLLADDPYRSWADDQRRSLAQLVGSVCTEAARRADGVGEYDAAIRLAHRAVEQEVLLEDAWQVLMAALSHAGRSAEALGAYADLRAATLDQLGVEPGHSSQTLYLAILHDNASRAEHGTRSEIAALVRLLRQAMRVEVDRAWRSCTELEELRELLAAGR